MSNYSKHTATLLASTILGLACVSAAQAQTSVTVGGHIDLDVHYTDLSDGAFASNSVTRDIYIPGAIPVVAGGGAGTKTTDFSAEASRFYIKAKHTDGDVKMGGKVELDFLLSAQGNQRVSNSVSPRLRHAYLDFNNFRFGQTWTAFQNTSSIPESASFLGLSDGMIFIRQPIIQYKSGPWQVSLENGNTTVTPNAGGRIEADSNVLPDGVIRYNASGSFGNVSVAVIGRELRIDTAGLDDKTTGWGLSVSGRLNVGEKSDIRFGITGGDGVGRYIGLNAVNAAAVDATGELEAIPVIGGHVALRVPVGETTRLSVGYSALQADNPAFLPGATTKMVHSGMAALLWTASNKVTFGFELMYGERETEAGDKGDMTRATFSTKLPF